MSNLLNIKQVKETVNRKHVLYSNKGQKVKSRSIKKLQDKNQDCELEGHLQINHSAYESPYKSKEKKSTSQKKISYIFLEPKQHIDSSYKSQFGRYRDLINISEKRLVQGLRKVKLIEQTKYISPKVKSFDIPLMQISQSVELTKLKNSNQKNFLYAKMPDLLKIKLKKQLQTIQKNQKPKKPHFMRYHNKSHLKTQNKAMVFLDQKIDKYEEQKMHEKEKQKTKKKIINEKRFNSFKKYEKVQKTQKLSLTLSHQNETIDTRPWQKRTITDEMDPRFLGNQRNQVKYSRLLEYVKKPVAYPVQQSPNKRKLRIKTQSSAYSSLIGADVNLLELEGTKIKQESLQSYEQSEMNVFLGRSKFKIQNTPPIQKREKASLPRKISYTEANRVSEEENTNFRKNHQISPWISFIHEVQNGLE